MTLMFFDSHPYWSIRDIVEKNCGVVALCFSYYTYVPQSLTDVREIFSISRSQFLDERFMFKVIVDTPDGQELALHSTVTMENGEILHFPMIDMSTGSTAHLEKVRPILGDELFFDFDWYKSGRSYHGYGKFLMNQEEWTVQMGKLLLVNKIGVPPTVDPRWVGHRLIAGYSALRWTRNTSHYVGLPHKVGGKNKL
ncbi:UNVERIFIED_ORG: hypothetical protein J2X80_002399 [Pseudomonas fluorescens]|nr:hypothetical protein [Pseudomonas fluorescens]